MALEGAQLGHNMHQCNSKMVLGWVFLVSEWPTHQDRNTYLKVHKAFPASVKRLIKIK